MARSRVIHPELLADLKLRLIEIEASFLYVGLALHMDRNGVTKADLSFIKSMVFPLRDDLQLELIDRWVQSLIRVGKIALRAFRGESYLIALDWREDFPTGIHTNERTRHPDPKVLLSAPQPGDLAGLAGESSPTQGAETCVVISGSDSSFSSTFSSVFRDENRGASVKFSQDERVMHFLTRSIVDGRIKAIKPLRDKGTNQINQLLDKTTKLGDIIFLIRPNLFRKRYA